MLSGRLEATLERWRQCIWYAQEYGALAKDSIDGIVKGSIEGLRIGIVIYSNFKSLNLTEIGRHKHVFVQE